MLKSIGTLKKKKLLGIRYKLPYYKVFYRKFVGYRNENTQTHRNKPDYFGLSKLELSKTVMYEFWYDYVKLKYGEKTKLCYMDTNSFIVYIKRDDIYKDIAKYVATRFDTSYYELDRPLPRGKNKKVIDKYFQVEKSWMNLLNLEQKVIVT